MNLEDKVKRRIFGLENEYGLLYSGKEEAPEFNILKELKVLESYGHVESGFLFNGDKVSEGNSHPETSTQECTSVSDVVICEHIRGPHVLETLISNSNDLIDFIPMRHDVAIRDEIDALSHPLSLRAPRLPVTSFGSHENYSFENSHGESLFPRFEVNINNEQPIVPFFIVRSILCGAGMVDPLHGELSKSLFHMTQRAFYWRQSIDTDGWFRPIESLNLTDDHFYQNRLHYGGGDTNIYPYTTALKIGLTVLMLDTWQAGLLPEIHLENTLDQFIGLSVSNDPNHLLKLEGKKTIPAIDLLETYLDAAAQFLKTQAEDERNPDSIWALTQARICIEEIRYTPNKLIGKLDLYTKRFILDSVIEEEQTKGRPITMANPLVASMALECERGDNNNLLYVLKDMTQTELVRELHVVYGLPKGDINLETAKDLYLLPIAGRPALRCRAMKDLLKAFRNKDFQERYFFCWDKSMAVDGHNKSVLQVWENPFGKKSLPPPPTDAKVGVRIPFIVPEL